MTPFKIGSIVQRKTGGPRLGVYSDNHEPGEARRLTCLWVDGNRLARVEVHPDELMADTMEVKPSPCVHQCHLNPDTQKCDGCGRTMQEITEAGK